MNSAGTKDRRREIAEAMTATVPAVEDFARSQQASIQASATSRHLLIEFAAEVAALIDDNADVADRLGLSVSIQHSGDDAFIPNDQPVSALTISRLPCRIEGCAGCCFLHLEAKGVGFLEYVEIVLDEHSAFAAISSLNRLEEIFRRAPIVSISKQDDHIVFEHKPLANPHADTSTPNDGTLTMTAQDLVFEFVNKLRANLKKRARRYNLSRG